MAKSREAAVLRRVAAGEKEIDRLNARLLQLTQTLDAIETASSVSSVSQNSVGSQHHLPARELPTKPLDPPTSIGTLQIPPSSPIREVHSPPLPTPAHTPEPPSDALSYSALVTCTSSDETRIDAAKFPLHYASALIWRGRYHRAEKFLRDRVGRPTRKPQWAAGSDVDYAWLDKHPHPRDALLSADCARMRFWVCGDRKEATTAAERYGLACDVADVCLRETQEALARATPGSDRAAILQYDAEDAKVILATATFFKAVFQIYTGSSLRGLASLKRGWSLFAEHMPANVTTDNPKSLQTSRRLSGRMRGKQTATDVEARVTETLKAREMIGLQTSWRMGLGIYLLIISMAPPKILKVLELVGFTGDRRLGGELLLKASHIERDEMPLESLPLAAADSAHILAWDLLEFSTFNFAENELPADQRKEQGSVIVRKMTGYFPESPIWQWLEAAVARRHGQFGKALGIIADLMNYFVTQEKSSGLPGRVFTDAVFSAILGEDHVQVRKFGSLVFESREGGSSFPIFPYAALGLSALLVDNRAAARDYFQRGAALQSSRPLGDLESMLHSKVKVFGRRQHAIVAYCDLLTTTLAFEDMQLEHLQSILSRLDRAIVALEAESADLPTKRNSHKQTSSAPGGNWLASPRLRQVLTLDSSSRTARDLSHLSSAEELAAAQYSKGCLLRVVYRATSEPAIKEQAIRILERVAAQNGVESWIGPFSHFQLSSLYAHCGSSALAKHHLEVARSYGHGFEGDRILSSMLKRLQVAVSKS